MTSPDRAALARLMALMATGDPAALFPFIEMFGGQLAGVVRRQLRSLGRDDVARTATDVDYLVQSAAFVLFDRAAGWDPNGALPWTWAERAIRAEIVQWLGHPAVEWNPDTHGTEAARASPSASAELRDLAGDHAEVQVLLTALAQVANERDGAVHVEYQVQKGLGDRSPANTVGDMFGLSPANVRQIDRRVRKRLGSLAGSESAFGALRGLSWVEAC